MSERIDIPNIFATPWAQLSCCQQPCVQAYALDARSPSKNNQKLFLGDFGVNAKNENPDVFHKPRARTCSNGRASQDCATAFEATRQFPPHIDDDKFSVRSIPFRCHNSMTIRSAWLSNKNFQGLHTKSPMQTAEWSHQFQQLPSQTLRPGLGLTSLRYSTCSMDPNGQTSFTTFHIPQNPLSTEFFSFHCPLGDFQRRSEWLWDFA